MIPSPERSPCSDWFRGEVSWILNVCDSSPNINTKSSCKKECVLLLWVLNWCAKRVCAGPAWILFARVGFLLLWVLSWCVRRVCTGLAWILFAGCCQNYSAKLVSLIANPSWFILLLGNVRPELHTEYASFLVLCLTTYSLMYYSYVTYFEIINMIFKKIFSC